MNVTKNIISDLLPLYAADECSADTRQLVEEYFGQHPQEAQQLRLTLDARIPTITPSPRQLDEARSLCEARRRVRNHALLLAVAIFFSLAPFSFFYAQGHAYWLVSQAPRSAVVYGALGLACWVAYGVIRYRSRLKINGASVQRPEKGEVPRRSPTEY